MEVDFCPFRGPGAPLARILIMRSGRRKCQPRAAAAKELPGVDRSGVFSHAGARFALTTLIVIYANGCEGLWQILAANFNERVS
jgi:hypothetical protein